MQILAAYFHFLGLAVLAACLAAECCLLQPRLTAEQLLRLRRIDMVYGITAGLMLAGGLARIYVEKGVDYYTGNPWFWLKMGLFTLTGLISLYPTITFLRRKPDREYALPKFGRLRSSLHAQIGLIAGIIACAVAMAR